MLRGLNWKTVLAFLDDTVVLGMDFDDHMSNLASTLSRFRKYKLKLKPKKCILFQKEIDFLCRRVASNSLSMTDQDIAVVREWPVPLCTKDVERFMGLANYHRTFVPNFSKLAEPMYRVMGKQKFKWEQEQEDAFNSLKFALTSAPVLALPTLATSSFLIQICHWS